MRKLVASVLSITMLMTLAACGVDAETKQVIDNINALGEIDTSDIDRIEEAASLYDNLTEEQKAKVTNYSVLEEATSQLDDLKKQYAVDNDKTPPTFEGLEDGQVIEVKGGSVFNLSDYLSDILTISDDVTDNGIEYRTDCNDEAYDSITGLIDTQRAKDIDIKLVASDEAGNESTLAFVIRIVPIMVTKDEPTPIVHDGEFGSISIKSFTHEDNYGLPMYQLVFDVNNTSDKDLCVALKSARTTVNGYQAAAYYDDHYVPAGVHGEMIAYIYDEDIPEEAGELSTIESYVCIFDPESDEDYLWIPITLDVNITR